MKRLILAIVFLMICIAVGCYINLMFINYFIEYGHYMYFHYRGLYWGSIVLHFLCLLIFAWIIKRPFDEIVAIKKSKQKRN
jgi:uncharacterized protein HemY